ncbi:MAG: pyruvate kinase [Hydrogenophaga sp.]|uniref:pyruvate kinase n=1 Tax=Hydrogenophaga sp. TaxID=1904254 RepID=UPI0027313673|nr:pyruvate kinase [Hydrogenophaga sp.]MDP2164726.1 pyruvate kinase [Hydrogenophaga sp.]MDP3475503.1 pyruvate kinase [Hydrogenophaga sp.]
MVKKHSPPSPVEIPAASSPWDSSICLQLIEQLWALRAAMLQSERRYADTIARVAPHQRASARNLVHFLALRATDLRGLQSRLAWLGLSSLGRAESHVLANVDKVLGILHSLTGQPWQDRSSEEPVGSVSGPALLGRHTQALLGPVARDRKVRIMVTLPSEAATDHALVRSLVAAGMDVARINCAHDQAADWTAMAKRVRSAAKAAQREVKILMDLAGPKIRTGPLPAGPAVLKLRPVRDECGFATEPSRLQLIHPGISPGAGKDPCIVVDEAWLARLHVGQQIHLRDARDKKRRLLVVSTGVRGAFAEGMETCYLSPETPLSLKGAHSRRVHTTYPVGIASLPAAIRLHRGDMLTLTTEPLDLVLPLEPPHLRVACTLPQVIGQVRSGERVWLDDGRIGAVVRKASNRQLELEIVQARDGGEKLMADKGINFPDSELDLPALTEKDLEDLRTAAKVADLVGLSFVQRPGDVRQLLDALQALRGDRVGVVLKIETLLGFESLPELMLAAMAGPCAGVMIARGDLAVECGFERMAEVQEEILWCSEAAHMPVIWATQVLENQAKTGVPSRAEISDAGMGVRAECVMLNKGPYIVETIRTLDDILRRMAGHQKKKTPLLRALRSWGCAD